MAYDNQITYAKFNSACTCGAETASACSCGCGDTSDDCGCCPIGTVAVYNEDGSHKGCLSPNDAEKYETGVHVPAEGFVKAIDPTTGTYYGDMSPDQAIKYLDFIINGTVGAGPSATFNVTSPVVGGSGFYELSYALIDGITDTIPLSVDRIGLPDAITISIINSLEDIQFEIPTGTVTVMPSGTSDLDVKFTLGSMPGIGVYTYILRFATTNVAIEVPIRLTLT